MLKPDHLENTKLALKYWLTVPAENVVTGLACWKDSPGEHTCGTIACFGGWVPAMPEFAAMGVVTTPGGAPAMPGGLLGTEVADLLFGEVGGDRRWCHGTLFDMPRDCSYDRDFNYDFARFDRTEDHALVTHRLRSHIKYLESQQ